MLRPSDISAFVPGVARTGPAAPASSAPGLFSADDYSMVAAYFRSRPELAPTPLRRLPALAQSLGLGALLVKDETERFGLNAFKLLGARFAIEQLLAEGAITPGHTLVCASEGNHGRAVAHSARALGFSARVYLADSVAPARSDAIAGEGATVVRVPGTYDDAVRVASADAAAQGWTVVSDTSWPGYEHIPRLIMLGYTRIMDEMVEATPNGWRPDVVVVPGGVGGLLAAVASWVARQWPSGPLVVAVEPVGAACLQASAREGRPIVLPGPFESMMGGLRCGEVSPLAFEAVLPLVAAYLGIGDDWAARAMRMLARPSGADPRIVAGASGAAALGGLLAALEDPATAATRRALRLGPSSTVVLIATEGMTDPPLWHRVIGDA